MMVLLLFVALGQQPTALSGVVTDPSGAVVAGAVVTVTFANTRQELLSAADGTWTTSVPAGQQAVGVRVTAAGFASTERAVTLPAATVRVELRPQGIAESVTVSADTATARLAIESSVTSIDRSAIAAAPALRLDDQLRSVPGFSLFRRTSSAVANPTTQGVTLRGLSASGASRTLVVADDVPLNDPFGGWVYWDRVPTVALQRIDVVRGASGDIHGNDALGGVIRLTTRTTRGAEGWLDGGSLGTARGSGYGALSRGTWMAGRPRRRMKTDGFIVVAPEARGTIDVPADSRSTSAMGWGGRHARVVPGHAARRLLQRAPRQRDAGPGERHGDALVGRQRPRPARRRRLGRARRREREQLPPDVYRRHGDRSRRRALHCPAVGPLDRRRGGRQLAAPDVPRAGADRGDEPERARRSRRSGVLLTGVLAPTIRTQPRQRGDGAVFQGRLDLSPRATVDAGARIDRWTLSKVDQTDPASHLTFFEPRVGLSFRVSNDSTLRVSWLTGFRTPTMNELYRSFRVGNTTTNANANLKPEKSSGPEVAFTMQRERWTGRAILYATRLSGAIYNRTVSSTQTAIVRERANGDARAIGSELELEWRAFRTLALTTAWALNDSKFTSGELDGKRTPQVPRVGGSVGVRANAGPFAGALNVRVIGAQFDDDINTLDLRKASLVDGRAGWRLSRRLELFGAIENALDREVDTGKTPLRTIGAPRMGRARDSRSEF